MNVLVVTAHPDDEVLGMGGTIARYGFKHNFHLAVIAPENKQLDLGDHDKGNKLEALGRACEILNIKHYSLHVGNQALMLDKKPMFELVNNIEDMIASVEPTMIFTHREDLHQDHVAVSKAVSIACRPKRSSKVKVVYRFQIPGPTAWTAELFRPNTFVPLTNEDLERKVEAMEQYWMEMSVDSRDANSEDGIYSFAEYYGRMSGVDWAEAFELDRKIGI